MRVIGSPRLVLVALAAVMLATAGKAAGEHGTTELRRIIVREAGAGVLRMELSRGVVPFIRELPATDDQPVRLYLDFPDTTLAAALPRERPGVGAIVRVRAGQFDPRTARVVVELAQPLAFAVDRVNRAVEMRLARPVQVARSAPPEPPALVAPPAPAPRATHDADPAAEIARRHAAGDWPGVVTLYTVHAETIGRDGSAATRVAIVDALRALGLEDRTGALLEAPAVAHAPLVRVARAEAAAAAGDVLTARTAALALEGQELEPDATRRLALLRARLALVTGDLADAVTIVEATNDPSLRREWARAALRVGDAASTASAWDRAAAAYRGILEVGIEGPLRAAAAASLLRVASAEGDETAAQLALAAMAETDDELFQRAARVLGKATSDRKAMDEEGRGS